jgi:membrane protein required for beta-lactamase induction
MTSLQLSVGWIWESSISDLFELTGANTKIMVGVKVILYILLAMCFAIILIVIHLYVRNWSNGEYDDDSALLYFDNNNYDNDSNNNDNTCEQHQKQLSGQQQQHEQLSGLHQQEQQQQLQV